MKKKMYIKKIDKVKSLFQENCSIPSRSDQEKRKKAHINNIRKEKGDTLTDPACSKMIRGYCEQAIPTNF